jgi:5'-deoxynucleotidase YfbR-like HD superfamily hydrolase
VRKFLAELDTSVLSPSGLVNNDRRMLRRTVYISRGLLNDANAEVDYVNLILTDIEEADFNRGFHLVYWGDVPFQPHVKMTYRDDGKYPCNRTFARLLDRIQSRLPHVPLIDMVTLLSLVQVRHVAGTLRERHRESVLELLKGKQLRQNFDLPGRVRGYVARIEEDLQQDTFDCATVLQEWDELGHIERTGWLRRRKEATGQDREFWNGQRIESVAEHTISTIGLAEVFLSARPTGEEIYNKDRVIALLLIHDFAESRVGDLIQGQQNHRAELEVLYKYGAFSTYRGIGDLWDIAERFREFSEGATIEGRIALDLDRLQFVLRARSYRAGMSEKERAGCEAARSKIVTATVHRIEKLLENYPVKARFVRPETEY